MKERTPCERTPIWVGSKYPDISLFLLSHATHWLNAGSCRWEPREVQVAGVSLPQGEQRAAGSKQNKHQKAAGILGALPRAQRKIGHNKCLLEKQVNPFRRMLVEYEFLYPGWCGSVD